MKTEDFMQRLVQDWPVKIICFVLALLLFLFYRMSTLEDRYFSVPLEIDSKSPLVPSGQYPTHVNVRVRGEPTSMYPISENDVSAFVDLSGFSVEGTVKVAVRSRITGSAEGTGSLEVRADPPELQMNLEFRAVKRVPVKPDITGVPETGYEFNGFTINPAVVEISGPRSAVSRIEEVETNTIDISGRNASYDGSVQVITPSPGIRISGTGRISFTVSIVQTSMTRTFSAVPFYFDNLDPDLQVETDYPFGRIQLKGARSELSSWSLPETVLTVLCEQITDPGEYTLPVYPVIDGPFEIQSIFPQEIVLTVTRKRQ